MKPPSSALPPWRPAVLHGCRGVGQQHIQLRQALRGAAQPGLQDPQALQQLRQQIQLDAAGLHHQITWGGEHHGEAMDMDDGVKLETSKYGFFEKG